MIINAVALVTCSIAAYLEYKSDNRFRAGFLATFALVNGVAVIVQLFAV